MKAQLREILKDIRVTSPGQVRPVPRQSSTANLTNFVTMNANRSSSKGPGIAQLNVTINNSLLQQRAAANVIPCKLPITKASHRNARPFLNLQVRSAPLQDIPFTYETNLKHLEYLFGDQTLFRNRMILQKRNNKSTTPNQLFEKRKLFLNALQKQISQDENNQQNSLETEPKTKYFKQL